MDDGNSPQLEQLNRALRQSEGLFHAIFDLATVGIAQLALDGRWLLMNRMICDILGYSKEELATLQVSRLCHPDDMALHITHLRRIVAGELSSSSMEKRCLRKDGSLVWVLLTVTLVRNERGEPEYFLAIFQDIDERKRAEEKLRQSEEKFRQIFRMAPIGITISTLKEGRFLDINETGERLSGYRRDEVVGRCAHEFSIWKEPGERAEVIEAVLKDGEVRDREMVMNAKGGRTFWGLYSGMVIDIGGEKHLLSLVSDIGERRKAEEALRESEERFRLLADNAPVLIWETDPDASCTFVNQAWLGFTGRSFEQELGYGWSEGVHPEDFRFCMDTFLGAVRERRPFSMEYRLRRGDGSYGWIVDKGVPRFARDGVLLGYLGTGHDVSEEKRVKEELQEANRLLAQRVEERTAELRATIARVQQEMQERVRIGQALQEESAERARIQGELREKELMLLHQGRLAAMGEMIGNIAHQWRQPLNLLALLTQELNMAWKRGEFDGVYLEKSVKKMLETIQHMSQTIGDFSNFFRPARDTVEFRVLEAIEKSISLLEVTLNAQQIKVELSAEGDPVVHGYPNEFSQVLLNIMINARDAFVSRGVVSPVIAIAVSGGPGRCVVTVTDNAGGIPEEILDRVFEPYFSTKPPDQGSGVGLFMSRTIIEKNMKGSLTARNTAEGAEFRIELGS